MQRTIRPMIGLVVALGVVTVTPKIRGVFFSHANANSQTIGELQSDKSVAWQTLLLFENQPLSEVAKPQKEKLQKAIDALVGKRENEFLVPRFLTKISDSKGQTRYALIEESPLLMIPGNSGLTVHIFALNGSLIRSSIFLTGWRIVVTDIRVTHIRQIDREALEIKSQPVINGRDVAKQFYALVNDQIVLIRLEDKAGRLIRNIYGAPNLTFGLALTGRAAKDWEQSLESNDAAELLATLIWLAGQHRDPTEPVPEIQGMPEVAHEATSEARLAHYVLTREGVQKKLKLLSASENLWVRQAANLAAKLEYFSWGVRIG